MNEQQHQLLSLLAQPPARLTVEQTAWLLNCQPHDIPVLVAAGLLRPLGNPPANGVKYYAATEIRGCMKDRAWLARATNAIHAYWRRKNGGRRERQSFAALP